ncbi:MAG: hypothetical protein ABJA78_19100 [Ferruginibacter sp.]
MKWLHFILSHSIFISLCATALVFQTAILLQVNLPLYLYLFSFSATLCSYNFYWMLSSYSLARQPPSLFMRSHLSNIIFFFCAAAAMVFSAFELPVILPYIGIAILLTILYAVPLMPFKFLRFTRKAGFLKTILLAFTWAYATVFIPFKTTIIHDNAAVWMLFNNRFIFMLMLCIIFDARDVEMDKLHGLRSLATDVKPITLRWIMIILFAAYIANGIIFRIYLKEATQITAFLTGGIATAVVYFYSLRKQEYFFYYFIVDGLMLLTSILTGLASI